MTCLTHNQQYGNGEHCVYCGNPFVVTVGTSSTIIGSEKERIKRKERARKAGRASAEQRRLSKLNKTDEETARTLYKWEINRIAMPAHTVLF